MAHYMAFPSGESSLKFTRHSISALRAVFNQIIPFHYFHKVGNLLSRVVTALVLQLGRRCIISDLEFFGGRRQFKSQGSVERM